MEVAKPVRASTRRRHPVAMRVNTSIPAAYSLERGEGGVSRPARGTLREKGDPCRPPMPA